MEHIITVAFVINSLFTTPLITYKATNEPLPKAVILSEYDIQLNQWVERLSICESGNRSDAVHHNDGKIGSDSIGVNQYKTGTWEMYTKKFGLPYSADDIWNADKQKNLTKLIIKNDYAYKNWKNCSESIGLPPRFTDS